ncbi:hypothetical protein OAC89_01305 [Deltaproteobacteria bacterium]|nr:hypothetical protein [Deltaproteobacteria bacterium]
MSAFLLYSFCSIAYPNQQNGYIAVPGLIDLRSTFSDGDHSIDDLAETAHSRGFKVIFISDHDRIALSYGLPPFRNIFRYKKEYPSIKTHSPERYLDEIKRVSQKYPDMMIIPGCETSAYYYWTGSWFRNNLTLNGYDQRMIIINFNNSDDYRYIPNLPSKMSFRYTDRLLFGSLIFAFPFIIGFILLRWKGFSRFMGIFLVIFSTLAIIDHNPFKSSLFSPYQKNQGIAPYQELIDYVNENGGLCFWNYPEQRSGIRSHGPINVVTPQYPHVLHESDGYTGFSAIYGEYTTVTLPGGEWDRVLNEYCRGERNSPPWGISSADFHEEGRLNQKLGSFPTIFLVREFSKKGLLESIKNGRMYCSRGDGTIWPKLDRFNVSGKNGEEAFMGDSLTTDGHPLVKIEISYEGGISKAITIRLIRGGELIQTFQGTTPMQIEYTDDKLPPGVKTYYRITDEKEHLVSNPIFVLKEPSIS